MKSLFFCLSILFLFIAAQNIFAAGLSVNMGIELLQEVPLGEEYLIKPTLIIYNKSDRANTFTLSTVKPSTGLGTTLGYSDLPELNWISFERNQIKIPPNGNDSVRVYLTIPKEERYYNQHWSFYISVASGVGGGNISLACYPKLLIETEGKQNLNQEINGTLVLEPNIVRFKDVQSGQPISEKIKIYNNSDKKQVYRISVLGSESCVEKRIFSTPGYNWIPDSSWVKLYTGKLSSGKSTPFRINVGANKSLSFKLEVNLPEDKKYKKWEGIILVESDQNVSNFVRIYIEP
ncbi:MAG: hypothetical protein MUO85_09925 [candidate division Zixibacteria bacterium]|nr:hypothetical protein [candidate division Zixibacteria bacterium]